MRRTLDRLSGLLLLAGTLCSTPVWASTHVYVQVGPPVVIVEPPPAMPHPGYVWRRVLPVESQEVQWVHGAWVNPPRGHTVWVPGHWAHESAATTGPTVTGVSSRPRNGSGGNNDPALPTAQGLSAGF
jgi:hypothetical protein